MYKLKDILDVAYKLDIDFKKFSLSNLIIGINIELEHGIINKETNVNNNDLSTTKKLH